MRRIFVSVILIGLLIAGVTTGSLFAQTDFTVLHSFVGGNEGGRKPYGSLISDGTTLYGMTYHGGSSGYGYGTVFSNIPASRSSIDSNPMTMMASGHTGAW